MIWPGMGDPYKRKKTIKYLLMTAGIGLTAVAASTVIQDAFNANNPLKECIDDRDTQFKISASLELFVDGLKAEIPANIGITEGCTHSLYTLTNDGTIYAEWEEEYPFEIGHFLWTWTTYHEGGFPMKDMDQSKSKIFVDGVESPDFFGILLENGKHYRAEFTSRDYDTSKDTDFMPPDL